VHSDGCESAGFEPAALLPAALTPTAHTAHDISLDARTPPPGAVGSDGWAAGGAAGLTGWPRRALPPPRRLVEGLGRLAELTASSMGVGVDPVVLLGERAAWTGWRRRGAVAVGGASHLLATADGWAAITLARDTDHEAFDALLADTPAPGDDTDAWTRLATALPRRDGAHWVERATWLGVPCAVLGEVPRPGPSSPAVHAVSHPGCEGRPLDGARVLDLSAMWAGPLCAHLLGLAGASVTKVETPDRPDGARLGPAGFYDTLHAGHRAVLADLDGPALHAAIRSADVVIEASRPRALRQAGINPEAIMASGDGPRVWVSISGYGRGRPDRVAFGDDAAVAGGLVARDAAGRPVFCLDAVADPLTGMTAAIAAATALRAGGRWHLDLSLARVAAAFAGGPHLAPWPPTVEIAAPRRRAPGATAPGQGQDGRLG
jgi:hypothetical protein